MLSRDSVKIKKSLTIYCYIWSNSKQCGFWHPIHLALCLVATSPAWICCFRPVCWFEAPLSSAWILGPGVARHICQPMSFCWWQRFVACSSRRLFPQHSVLPPAARSHRCMAAISPDEGGRCMEVHFRPHSRQTVRAPLGGEVERHKAGQKRVKGGGTFIVTVFFLFQAD